MLWAGRMESRLHQKLLGKWFLAAFILLLVLLGAIFVTMRKFTAINERSGDLLIPYFLWVTFAGYLNLGVFLLN